jgi:glycosyltransferase involved in cell wall biosynthesis
MNSQAVTAAHIPVLLVVRALPAHRPGGLEYHTLDLANGMHQLGHPVTVLTTECSRPGTELSHGLDQAIRVLVTPECFDGHYSQRFWNTAARMAAEWAREHAGRCVVHSQEYAGIGLPRSPGGGFHVVTVHGTVTSEVTVDGRYLRHLGLTQGLREIWRHKGRLAMAPLFVRMLRRANDVVVDSQFTKGRLDQHYGWIRRDATVVPCGTDWSRVGPKAGGRVWPREFSADEPLRLMMLQRIQRQKGIHVVLDAMARLASRNAPVRLRIGGGGEHLEELKAQVAARDLGPWVEVLGRVPEEEVAKLYGESHGLVVPDLTQPAYGLTVSEAAYHGIPVIAARSGALPENVDRLGGWVYDDPWDADALAQIVAGIVTSPEDIAERSAALMKSGPPGDHLEMATSVSAIYHRLISGV